MENARMFFRLNIRRTKALVWTLNLLAIAGISLLFLLILNEKKEGKFNPGDHLMYDRMLKQGSEREQQSGPRVIDINDYDALWRAPISGIRKAAEIPEDVSENAEIAQEPLGDLVQVMVILKSSVPAESRVRLYYPKAEAETERPFKLDIWSKEGDKLKPPYDVHPYLGEVKRIEDDHVVFSYRGEEVALAPSFINSPEGSTASAGAESPSGIPAYVLEQYKEPPAETVEVKPGCFYLSTKEKQYWAEDWEGELKNTPVAAVKNPQTEIGRAHV